MVGDVGVRKWEMGRVGHGQKKSGRLQKEAVLTVFAGPIGKVVVEERVSNSKFDAFM